MLFVFYRILWDFCRLGRCNKKKGECKKYRTYYTSLTISHQIRASLLQLTLGNLTNTCRNDLKRSWRYLQFASMFGMYGYVSFAVKSKFPRVQIWIMPPFLIRQSIWKYSKEVQTFNQTVTLQNFSVKCFKLSTHYKMMLYIETSPYKVRKFNLLYNTEWRFAGKRTLYFLYRKTLVPI